jgi:hypothetical protein
MLLTELSFGRKNTADWWRADWASMRADLDAVEWDELDGMNADEAWSTLKRKINETVSKHVPMKPKETRIRNTAS